jgi:hypothetical protein
LQRGKCLDRISDPEALVSSQDLAAGIERMVAAGVVVERMEELHQRLCASFRHAVKTAFAAHGDVLDAGGAVQVGGLSVCLSVCLSVATSICVLHVYCLFLGCVCVCEQEMMHSFMTGEGGPGPSSGRLRACERLQVHMDCLNAHGQLVGIEDVDDMGGQVCSEPLYLCGWVGGWV